MSDASLQLLKPQKLERLKSWISPVWLVIFLLPIPVAIFDLPNLLPVLSFAVKALVSTLPYILFALVIIATLKAAGAEAAIANVFKGREVRMIFVAALFGGLAPFCSCEVIPFVAGLLALGAPLSAVMAFWLSSPLIDPPTLLITAAALGWPFAIGKAASAVALGLFGGFAMWVLSSVGAFQNPLKKYQASGCECGPNPMDGKPLWSFWQESARLKVFQSEFIENGKFLLKWLSLAYVLEALLVTYVPASLIAGVVGGEGIAPIAISALVGMPAYLNSYVAPALLAGLIEQGMSEGAAMAFMVAGAVSSIPAMVAVFSLVRPHVFAMYLGLGVGGAIVSGVIFQFII